jgi:chromosome partitioning protein
LHRPDSVTVSDTWVARFAMRTIAFVTQKGGAGKTTLAASLAVAAASAGERVVALDFDPQGSLARWGQRRGAANAAYKVAVEQFEAARLPRLGAILQRIADAGFTLAIFDTPGADSDAVRAVAETADICLLPARPTHLDVEATASTFRAIYLAKRKAAFVLNQCPPTPRSARASDAAKDLTQLGILAEPMLSSRIDYQDAVAKGLGVTEYAGEGRAAQEIAGLWSWIRTQFELPERETAAQPEASPKLTSLRDRLAAIARYPT